jgi:superfamily II DNA or RNA helicase
MSPTESERTDSRMKLLPHQTALADTVLNAESKRIILLRGDVGLGKGTALVALARRLLQERPGARALFLVPAAARWQFVERLRAEGTQTLLVDRYQFREMLDSTMGGEFWPRGVAIVLSQDFAKQSDILESLTGTRWDLVIADEAHGFTGARAQALQRVGASAERVVLATATLPDFQPSGAFPTEDATVVEWRRDRVVDHDGKLLDTAPRPVLHEVPFSLTPPELSLRETVRHLCRVLEGSTAPQTLNTKSAWRRLESSPPAVESILRRIAEPLLANATLSPEFADEEPAEDQPNFQSHASDVEEAARLAIEALKHIEEISVDSKLNALRKLLSALTETEMGLRRICVLTDYVATLFYLAADIEDCGMGWLLMRGAMSVEDRHRSLTSFRNAEGILLATQAVTEGLSLGEVTDLVLYDIPSNPAALQNLLARFHRFGIRNQLSVHVLVAADSVLRAILDKAQTRSTQ